MILFKLKCAARHEFEGWFRDNAAFERQSARHLITCPHCGDQAIEKAPMAPRLGRAKEQPSPESVARALRELRHEIEAKMENVGDRFAEEARRIHYGEAKARGIFGDATDDEARDLADEGIEVARIPWLPPTDA
ncbi:MAG TPA: DUF1178 family protein [Stellaceae bacterium]|nr:DUF1178 family protein [Stellaceae bacterium]